MSAGSAHRGCRLCWFAASTSILALPFIGLVVSLQGIYLVGGSRTERSCSHADDFLVDDTRHWVSSSDAYLAFSPMTVHVLAPFPSGGCCGNPAADKSVTVLLAELASHANP